MSSSFTHSPHGSIKQLSGSFRLNHRSFHGSSKSPQQRGGSLRQHAGSFKYAIPETQHLNPNTSNNEQASTRLSLLPPTDNSGCQGREEDNAGSGAGSPQHVGQDDDVDHASIEFATKKADSLSLVPVCSDNSISAASNKQLPVPQEELTLATPKATTMTGQICRTKGSLKRHINKEGQTARITGVMLVTYLIFHLPYFTAILVDGMCESCSNYFPAHVVFALEWLSFSVRAINPIIYHTLNRDFRQSFVRLLHIG